jgi:hypothetical protein
VLQQYGHIAISLLLRWSIIQARQLSCRTERLPQLKTYGFPLLLTETLVLSPWLNLIESRLCKPRPVKFSPYRAIGQAVESMIPVRTAFPRKLRKIPMTFWPYGAGHSCTIKVNSDSDCHSYLTFRSSCYCTLI